jgi:hypothetical protein
MQKPLEYDPVGDFAQVSLRASWLLLLDRFDTLQGLI